MKMSVFDVHTSENTEPFRFQHAKSEMRVVDAHDGDTIKVIMEVYPGFFCKASLRLYGIDTPEITSKVAETKRSAIRARDRLVELISGSLPDKGEQIPKHLQSKTFVIHADVLGVDKYGRVLADCKSSKEAPETFSEILIREKLGVKYGGGNKIEAWAALQQQQENRAV